MWNSSSKFGQRVEQRLAEEQVAWLVTTDRAGTPQPNPIWFLWDGVSLLLFTRPDAAKVRHIQERPRVALHFNTDSHGEDVVVLTGTASVDPTADALHLVPAYMAKYGSSIPHLGLTPAQMAATYSVAIRVKLEKVRGF